MKLSHPSNAVARTARLALVLALFAAFPVGRAGRAAAAATISPPPRFSTSMAYDASTSAVLLFGGCCDASGSDLGDTWSWNGSTWSQLSPITSPPARSTASMAYDADHATIVLFGGTGACGSPCDDTWIWDGANWSAQHPPTSPPARSSASMAYDEIAGTTVLFGGAGAGSCTQTGPDCNDTWTWDGSTWAQSVSGEPATSPPPRESASMAYEVATQTVVLFGGAGQNCAPCADTWSWSGSSWSEASPPTHPPARLGAAMAYDPVAGQIVLFGGQGDCGDVCDDTWGWNGSTWALLHPASSPMPRRDASAVDDTSSGTMLLFGGDGLYGEASCCVDLDDTWTWNGSAWTQLVPPSPRVTAISQPPLGPTTGGTFVAIGGRFLDSPAGTAISFGSSPATGVRCTNTGTLCTATSPPGTGTVDVTATTPGGASTTGKADQFSYSSTGPYVGVSIQPAAVLLPVSGSTSVTLQGQAPPTGLAAWTIDLQYDPGVVQVSDCTVLGLAVCNPSFAPNIVRMAGFSLTGIFGSQPLASITLTTAGGATLGASTSLTPIIRTFADDTGALTSATPFGAVVTLSKLGDVNGDGQVTSLDALCVLRIVAGLPSTAACPIPPPGGSIIVAGETAPTAVDALCILRGVVGLPATATCPAITAPITGLAPG